MNDQDQLPEPEHVRAALLSIYSSICCVAFSGMDDAEEEAQKLLDNFRAELAEHGGKPHVDGKLTDVAHRVRRELERSGILMTHARRKLLSRNTPDDTDDNPF